MMAIESETVETLEAAALQLTPADRARLVERLIATLDADPEIEEAWSAEVERRQAEIEKETVSLRPARNPHDVKKAMLSQSYVPCAHRLNAFDSMLA